MIYTRTEIVDLCEELGGHEASLLVSLVWHLSHGDPNCQSHTGRFGLLQLRPEDAREFKLIKHESELLDARTNLELGSKILASRGLLAFLGREFAGQYHSILGLASFLETSGRTSETSEKD